MTNTQHTPGPWHCDSRTTLYATPDDADEIIMLEITANVTEAGWDTVAFIQAIWLGAEANARLIAAAPALLRFLERWLSTQPGDTYNGYISDQELKAEAEVLYATATTPKANAAYTKPQS